MTETFSTAKLDDQAKCFCIHWPSQLLSSPFLHSLSISFGSILHSIDPGAASAFTQEHGQQHICNFSKRFLNIAIPSIMQADWGRRFSTTGASFCNSFANEDFDVFFTEPSGAARDQVSGPQWMGEYLFHAELPCLCNNNHLCEQCTVGLKYILFGGSFSELHFLVHVAGISSSSNVSTRSKIGLYCLISTALRSDFQDCTTCRAVSSPDSSVQLIMQLLLVSEQIRFFGASYDDMNSELLFSPNKM